jgi:hypothetical protein
MPQYFSILNHSEKRSSAVSCKPFFQPKLSISQPNDIYEQEANNAAQKVMSSSTFTPSFFFPVSVQRKCAECEEEEKKLQRKENNSSSSTSSSKPENYISSVTDGKPLGNEEKSFFESRMGYNFSDVRIYTDSNANQSAKNINALAYTHGNNIVFGQGQYQPGTNEGKKLLAHELTHVIQQSSTDISMRQAPEMIQRAMDKDPSELDDDVLKNEYDAYNEYVHNIDPADYAAEEDNMNYFLALEKELKRRCLKSPASHPKEVSQKLVDRITGKYAGIDGDPGEGLFLTPYVASEGQCTIGYGHVIFPKSSCTIKTETKGEGKTKKSCECASPGMLSPKTGRLIFLNRICESISKK